MASARSIEVKVGMLILTALVLLAGFILVMGGISFEPTYELVVGFDNPGGLQAGAPVKIAGVKVGKVSHMRFNTADVAPAGSEQPALVYAHIGIEKRYQNKVHDNAVFYITTQGVLGEQFMAIDPGSSDRPLLDDGAMVRGLDPPRLDRLIAESYDLLHTTVHAMRENKAEIAELFDGLTQTLKGTGTFFHRNQDRIDAVAQNVQIMSEEGVVAIQHAREKYIDNPAIDRILVNVEHLSQASARDVPVLLEQSKRTMVGAEKIVGTFSSDAEIARFRAMLDDVHATTKEAKAAIVDARVIASHIRGGKGSVGALVMDEQLFDDLQELARDLKHNPWKLFWKE
jgi:phospholipid/cholesterol/gamma-HCH transport system substrate-binding protein